MGGNLKKIVILGLNVLSAIHGMSAIWDVRYCKVSLQFKKKICELVRQFPVIFDKSNKGYKEKDAEVKFWNEITNSLDFINDGMYYILATI